MIQVNSDFEGDEFEPEFTASSFKSDSGVYRQPESVDAVRFSELDDDIDSGKVLKSPAKPLSQDKHTFSLYNNSDQSPGSGIQFLNPNTNTNTKHFRNGLLQALLLNELGISAKVRYAFLTDEEALRRGINLNAVLKLRKITAKLEEIYRSASGYRGSITRAILTGSGNGYVNHVPFNSDNDTMYADQSEYDVLHRSYSESDNNSARVQELLRALDATLKQVNGLEMIRASTIASRIQPASASNGNAINENGQNSFISPALHGNNGQSVAVSGASLAGSIPISMIVPKAEGNFIARTAAWITENPGTSLLIAGTLIGGGILIKQYFDKEKSRKAKTLHGLGRTKSKRRSKKRTVEQQALRQKPMSRKSRSVTLL